MDQMFDLFRLAALALAVMFMTLILKKAGRDVESTAVSIIGVIIALTIVIGYVLQFFEAVETMLTF